MPRRDCVAAAMDVNNRWAKEAALMDDLSIPKSIDMLSLIRGLAQVVHHYRHTIYMWGRF